MQERNAGLACVAWILLVSTVLLQPLEVSRPLLFKPVDSAYVVADLNDNGTNRFGYRTLNTGGLPITKVWYAWNLTVTDKTTGNVTGYIPVKIVSWAYIKFNLSGLQAASITNATLNLYAINSNLTATSRSLVAYLVGNNTWTQGTLAFDNAPGFDQRMNQTTLVTNGLDGWCRFDLTQMARSRAGGELSIVVVFLVLYEHSEEQVVFDSPRATSNQPYLSVTEGPSAGPLSSLEDFFTISLTPGFWISPGALLILAAAAIGLYFVLRNRSKADEP